MADLEQNEEEDRRRLAEAIEVASGYIRESAISVGIAEHIAMVALRDEGEVEAKVVTRESVARLYAGNAIVERLLARGVEPGLIPVVAIDFRKSPSLTVSARIPVVVQGGGDA